MHVRVDSCPLGDPRNHPGQHHRDGRSCEERQVSILLPDNPTGTPTRGSLCNLQRPSSRHPTATHHRPSGPGRQRRPAATARSSQERQSPHTRGHRGRDGRDPLAHPSGVLGAGVPVFEGRTLSQEGGRALTPTTRRTTSTRAPRARASQDWPSLGGQSGRNGRSLDQGHPGPTRSPIGAKYAPVRAPRRSRATPFGASPGAIVTASRQRQVNEHGRRRRSNCARHRNTKRN